MEREQIQILARQAKQGDSEALERLLVEPYIRNIICKIAREIVGEANQEDIYQDMRVIIYESLPKWQETAHVIHWISTITKNTCFTFLRKTKPDRFVSIEENPPPESSSPCDQLLTVTVQEKEQILHEALQEMGEDCRQMLTLHLVEKMPKREIRKLVPFGKTKFHRNWNRCCEILTKKIQRMMQK